MKPIFSQVRVILVKTEKSGKSGNTDWPQASDFQKLAKMDYFCPFFVWTFVLSKCKRSSLRSQC